MLHKQSTGVVNFVSFLYKYFYNITCNNIPVVFKKALTRLNTRGLPRRRKHDMHVVCSVYVYVRMKKNLGLFLFWNTFFVNQQREVHQWCHCSSIVFPHIGVWINGRHVSDDISICFYLNEKFYIDGLAQDCCNSIANALELLQSCTKPSIYGFLFYWSMLLKIQLTASQELSK